MENPNIVYGRLTESVHLSGYTLERAIREFKWLIEEDRWMKIGIGFDDVDDFVKSLNFSEFRFAIEQRQEIARKLAELHVSQRTTAGMLGVSKETIRRDTGTNVPKEDKMDIEYEEVIEDTGTNVPDPLDNLTGQFEKSGKNVVDKSMKNVHVENNSGENEWYTPSEIIEAAKNTMGSIDLDPATSLKANETVKAEQIFTKEDNGLIQKWSDNVWMNPPYSQGLMSEFSDKLISELSNINQACVLVNNATETNWFQNILNKCDCICFLKGRVKYLDSTGTIANSPLQGQAVLYFGGNQKEFFNNFYDLGICLIRMN